VRLNLQVTALLGPRTPADEAPVEKVKNKAASKAAKAATKVGPATAVLREEVWRNCEARNGLETRGGIEIRGRSRGSGGSREPRS
jgi:hypothetical protein